MFSLENFPLIVPYPSGKLIHYPDMTDHASPYHTGEPIDPGMEMGLK
jgi:hypothetical protein